MSVSKRFKKKIQNFRQGMTAWYVNSHPIRDENYRDWGKDQEELDRQNGKGNSTCFQSNSGWVFIQCKRICKVPTRSVWGWVDDFNGKRRTHQFKSLASLQGAHGGRYFKTAAQARVFMQEIIDGLHPGILGESAYYHGELDRLDEILDDTRIDETDYDDHGIYGDFTESEYA